MENILSGIEIPVEDYLALKTSPLPILEGQSIVDPAALETSLARWEKPVELIEPNPVPLRLVGKLADKFSPTRVSDGFSKPMIRAHPFDVQVLHTNLLVLADKPGTCLVKKILSSIRYFLVLNCQKFDSLGSVRATLLFARHHSLKSFQSGFCRSQMLRRFNAFTVRRYGECFQAEINAYLPTRLFRFHRFFDCAKNRGEVFASLGFGNCDALRLSFDRPMIHDFQNADLRYLDRSRRYGEILRYRERLLAAFGFEFWKLSALIKKIIVGNVKLLQCGLKRLSIGLVKPGSIRRSLENRQQLGSIEIVERLFLLALVGGIEVDALAKEIVEDKARRSKLTQQGFFLLPRRIESESERLVKLHVYHYSRSFVEVKRGRLISAT